MGTDSQRSSLLPTKVLRRVLVARGEAFIETEACETQKKESSHHFHLHFACYSTRRHCGPVTCVSAAQSRRGTEKKAAHAVPPSNRSTSKYAHWRQEAGSSLRARVCAAARTEQSSARSLGRDYRQRLRSQVAGTRQLAAHECKCPRQVSGQDASPSIRRLGQCRPVEMLPSTLWRRTSADTDCPPHTRNMRARDLRASVACVTPSMLSAWHA